MLVDSFEGGSGGGGGGDEGSEADNGGCLDMEEVGICE